MKRERSTPSPASRFTFHVSRITLRASGIPHSALRTLHSQRAFTMIEIAISLAVIGFALVAIIGVLPVGMKTQQENREETIINQEASVFVSAICNGARGMDDLANYVVAITNQVVQYDRTMHAHHTNIYGYTRAGSSMNGSSMSPQFALTSGSRVIGLLSTPKVIPQGVYSPSYSYRNNVVAYVRSMSGPASDKFPQNNASLQDLAFSYRMLPEVVAFGGAASPNVQNNLHELRLNFRWPMANGINAPGRQVFRTLVAGGLQKTNEPGFTAPDPSWPSPYDLYFFEPRTYVKAP